jgi:Fe-S-cluster containining protein
MDGGEEVERVEGVGIGRKSDATVTTATTVVPVEIDMEAGKLRSKVPVPTGEVSSAELMPVFRSLSEVVVHLSVMAAGNAGKKVSCHDGCAACCRHLVPVSETEAFALLALVDSMPPERREALKQRFATAAQALRHAGLAERLLNPLTIDAQGQEDLAPDYYRLYLDCPFLEGERCSIYEERPIVCREFLMTSPAENCRPLRMPLERVPVRPSANRGLYWMYEKPGTAQAPWVALAMLMEWAERRGGRGLPLKSGPEHLARFVECINAPR